MKKAIQKHRRTLVFAALLLLLMAVAVLAVASRETRQRQDYPLEYQAEVEKWATEYDVDPYLVYAVILTESGFRPEVDSSAGARGLMQMTKDTFDWVKSNIAPDEALEFDDLYKPEVSVRFGVYFLWRCLQRYQNDVSTAAAAYHSGWGTVDGLLSEREYSEDGLVLQSFPHRQMNHYVNKVNKAYQKYIQLYA